MRHLMSTVSRLYCTRRVGLFRKFEIVIKVHIILENIILEDDILQEKQRSAKFNENELSLLNGLIKKYKHVILNKKTGQVTPKQREEVWQAINVEFNCDPACSVSRSVAQLKNKWDYMKRNAKKDVAAYKKAHRQTGGGKGPAPLDDTTAILLDTVRESVEGVPSNFDSDNAISNNIVLLDSDSIEILSKPVTVTLPEDPLENTTKSCYVRQEQKILGTPNINKIDAASVSDLCQNSVQIKKRRLNMNDTSLAKSTPQYTRSKFVDVAEKKLQWLDGKQDLNKKKSSIELEILGKKSENASLENTKLVLECDAQNLEIEIKQLIKKKLQLEIALLEKQLST